ncbi:MAG: SLC13 family permease [Gammaproteobacteria bacterium]
MALLIVLIVVHPVKLGIYTQLVNWPTIGTLLGLMILTKGLELSGWLHRLGQEIVVRITRMRTLALFLIAGSGLLAMLLTNDIALFVVVPLTLRLGELAKLPVRRLVIFEALAVNAGSMFTPIGNPQNILLWQLSGMHFARFMLNMLPPFVATSVCLLLLTLWVFPAQPIHLHENRPLPNLKWPLLMAALLLYIPFLVLTDLHHAVIGLILVLAIFAVGFPHLLSKIDWPLLVVFVLMFIDLGLMAQYPVPGRLQLGHTGILYLAGLLGSQIISNVPATIVLTKYSSDWITIAWAVNLGGFGLVTGSLANLIALRLGRQPGSLGAFHAWSLPFFLVVGMLTGLWLLFR